MLNAMLLLVVVASAGPPKPIRTPGQGAAPITTKQTTAHLRPMGAMGIAKGYDRLKAGQFALAEDRFRLELDADPSSVPAKRGLALAHAARRSCDEAIPELHALRVAGSWDVDLATAEGNCGLRSGDLSLSVVAFEEGVLLEPNDADAWYGLARARRGR